MYDILGYRMIKDYKVPKFPTMRLIKRKIKKEIKVNIKEDYAEWSNIMIFQHYIST